MARKNLLSLPVAELGLERKVYRELMENGVCTVGDLIARADDGDFDAYYEEIMDSVEALRHHLAHEPDHD